MNQHRIVLFLSAVAIEVSCKAQGTFVNLDFESANVPPTDFGYVSPDEPVSRALPGWSVWLGPYQQSSVKHNNANLDTAYVSLNGPYVHDFIFQGQYTCVLAPGTDPVLGPGHTVDASIAQTGTVPVGTRSLRFSALGGSASSSDRSFAVYFAGEELSLSPVLVASDHTVYTADIGRFAGQLVELRFTSFWIAKPNGLFLDDIQFSPEVPEPSTWVLVTLGTGFVVAMKRKGRKPDAQ